MTAMRLVRIEPGRNMRRFYRLDVQPDFFGGDDLVCEWACIGRGGQLQTQHHEAPSQTYTAMIQRRRTKERRGYVVPARLSD